MPSIAAAILAAIISLAARIGSADKCAYRDVVVGCL